MLFLILQEFLGGIYTMPTISSMVALVVGEDKRVRIFYVLNGINPSPVPETRHVTSLVSLSSISAMLLLRTALVCLILTH